MGVWSIGPKVPSLRRLLWTGFIGAVLAGLYGALHDQISITISPEYFTHIKFRQFKWLGLELHPRIFAAIIGLMATWWVGFAGGWLLGRLGPSERSSESNFDLAKAITVALAITIVSGMLGALLGWIRSFAEPGDWKVWHEILDSRQLRGLIIVTYLHWASYIGGTLGLVAAAVYYRQLSRGRSKNTLPTGRVSALREQQRGAV